MKMKKGRKKKFYLIVAILLLLLVATGSAIYMVARNYYNKSNYTPDDEAMNGYEPNEEIDEIDPNDSQGEVLTPEEEEALNKEQEEVLETTPVEEDDDVYNVLLIGVDRRNKGWAGNSDSMILMSLNHDKKQISMISLMRDTYVNIPGIGMRKLNAAHANGAGPLLLKTVEENFKIDVDRYVTVDFSSMITIIDKLGGIELTMSNAEAKVANNYIIEMCEMKNLDPEKYKLSKGGTRKYNGIQAVAYARIRYVGHSDYQRTERQRTVLTKMLEKMKSMGITELFGFAEDVLPLVTHNIPEKEIWELLGKAPALLEYQLVKDRIPYDGLYRIIYVKKQDMLVPDWEKTIEKLKATLY